MGIFDRIKGLFSDDDATEEPAPQVRPKPAAASHIPGWSGPDAEDPEVAQLAVDLMEIVTAEGFTRQDYASEEFQAGLDELEEARDFNDLVEVLRRANVALGDHWPAVRRLALLYVDLYDNESAATLFLRLANAGQHLAESYYQLGDLAEREDRSAEAAAYYQRAIAEDVGVANAWQRAERLKEHLPMPNSRAAVTVGGVESGGSSLGVRPPEGFELKHPIGRGGYGTVYLARDVRLRRDVAIKFLHPHLTQDARRAEAFFEEARLVARLGLPGVVRIYDLDPDDTLIVMEYLTRGTLRDRLASGRPLAPAAALRVAMELLKTLSRLHAKGLIHRDIKPENILFRSDGTTVLGDFGVATLEAGELEARAAGTLAYMAPEQKGGGGAGRLDRRVDIYALGLVLVEMLAGVVPPASPGRVQPPEVWIGLVPRSIRPMVAPTIRRLLAVDPDMRVSDARHVYTELRGVRQQVLYRGQASEVIEELEKLAELGGGGPESEAFIAMVKAEML